MKIAIIVHVKLIAKFTEKIIFTHLP